MDKHTQRNEQGQIDIAASTNNYAKALSVWISENETDQDKIEASVNAVMDRYPNNLFMPMLINLSVQEISDDPTKFKTLEKRIKAFIKTQRETGKIEVKKGAKPGIKRVSEITEPAETEENLEEATG